MTNSAGCSISSSPAVVASMSWLVVAVSDSHDMGMSWSRK
jgi:hypothetical protein